MSNRQQRHQQRLVVRCVAVDARQNLEALVSMQDGQGGAELPLPGGGEPVGSRAGATPGL
ncbi:hypothetical protein OHB35_51385 [Streptomyces phaeochromogenes]|uniref:Uncharacterized protein n=1 Tax=Streptomyces phaeochromogenes TaxID=1923 RepID=A0ABZ1HQV6_STRPH|nr:hypothetical protein [Streptomyces phaeochromogenes]WSD20982.1 hypothetical protein OHB35_51385 [Streptomyces phaeochromogenes]